MSSKSSTILLFTAISVVLALAVAIAIATVIIVSVSKKSDQGGTTNCETCSTSWQSTVCSEKRQCSKGWNPLPVLIVSMDGFRADYLDRAKTPSVQKLIDCGANVSWMYPSYPSVTFPNHYSVVTGLYPESHGIVGNVMWDPKITPLSDDFFCLGCKSSLNPQWWGGEPLWNTVMKNGRKAATMFWPGSDVPIQNMRPTYYHLYNSSFPFTDRVNQVVEWLLLPDSDRPSLINLYFNQPDHTGHQYGPDSHKIDDELVFMDGIINYLYTKLHENDLLDCLNVIILADHGMQEVLDQIVMDDFFNINGTFVFDGPVAKIMRNGTDLSTDQIVDALSCKHDKYRVYARPRIPRRLHFTRNFRIGDLIVDSDLGYVVNPVPRETLLKGDHGYDFRKEPMHALFLTNGPGFKKGYTGLPFENIEIYNLVSDLLKLEVRAPNNGTVGSLRHLLKEDPSPPEPTHKATPDKCPFAQGNLIKCGTCPTINNKGCSTSPDSAMSFSDNFCVLQDCFHSIFYDRELEMPFVVQSTIESDSKISSHANTTSNCNLVYENGPQNCDTMAQYLQDLKSKGMGFYHVNYFGDKEMENEDLFYGKLPMYDGFVKDLWTKLQLLTADYSKTYSKVLVTSGAVFDYNYDGLADSIDIIRNNTDSGSPFVPTHLFHTILRCGTGGWNADGLSCVNANEAQVISFVLPNQPDSINCQSFNDRLFENTARLRDIEELTGLKFFTDVSRWPPKESVRLRIHINQELW